MKTLCATGHRPEGLQIKKGSLTEKYFLDGIQKCVDFAISLGATNFIAGGALGFDTEFAKNVINRKENENVQNSQLYLEIAVPCRDQSRYFYAKDLLVYNSIIAAADKVTVLSESYSPYCMQRRNEYMVDNSDAVLCCWNGETRGGTYSTIKYAQKCGKPLIFLPLASLPKTLSQAKTYSFVPKLSYTII